MSRTFTEAGSASYFPDGLDDTAIEALIAEADLAVASAPAPTSALLDGSAAERCRRRVERRAVAAVVRTLPVRPAITTGSTSGIEDIAS